MKSLTQDLKEKIEMNPMDMLGKPTDHEKKMKEVNDLIGYGIKEGYIDDSAEFWSDEEKVDYYNSCEAYDYKD